MTGSQNSKIDIVLSLYKNIRSVFRLIDVAMLTGETDMLVLSKKLNYYVRKKQIGNPRKGIYAKPGYDRVELACCLYTPCYISLEYVLQQKGIIFQYDTQITAVSYLSRITTIGDQSYRYRKLKGELLVNTAGVVQLPNMVNIAVAERAFLDMLYLSPGFYFDNINSLDKSLIRNLLQIYQSAALTKRVEKLLQHV
ncbi:MAG: hypothetical protein HGA37_17010 [Lentimicrobium sp.]|nr:hypothetical protein [Lentimicrobium sp.]